MTSRTGQPRARAKDRHRIIVWKWQGRNTRGKRIHGEMAATEENEVRRHLAQQGISLRRISRKRSLPIIGNRIRSGDITLFARQMATMIRAGIPLLQSFSAVANSTTNPALRHFIETLHQDVSSGMNFSSALAKHPGHIDDLFVHLVAAGEQAGALDRMLERIAIYKERLDTLRSRVMKAMYYPASVIAVGLGVTALLLIKVVPQFETMFSSFGAELPMPTQITIELSETAQAWWWQICLALLGGVVLLRSLLRRSPVLAMRLSRLALGLPILGGILEKSAIARFARTLSTSFAAGVPLMEALDTASGACGNQVFARAVSDIRTDVSNGQQLHAAMRNTNLFSPMSLQMVAIGEEAGSLDDMLDRVAEFHEAEVENRVDTLTSLLEPFIIVVLGTLVGGLVMSMYLPVFELGNAI
ncbi:type II secretion system F family protein [Kushneria phosphatilytica]|uniref:Type II secretion system F family protein n=1 Tax=Kushneria phosphatilytica TaxID=657387 RepID=A0A1S1NXX0_9GAMM|nr:type II secretion system F family protein [Kushneria phosphatilytica]OHV12216.1 type II secretion system protein F [Kushneria phosphatilytica]QEL11411.1 type II secretion system F family protein [Kushneria phosphatilytica]